MRYPVSVAAACDGAYAVINLVGVLFNAGAQSFDGLHVFGAEAVAKARALGATDIEIHDTVLIAAAFCMYNRYVDGLGTWQPREPEMYIEMGRRMAEQGYAGARK